MKRVIVFICCFLVCFNIVFCKPKAQVADLRFAPSATIGGVLLQGGSTGLSSALVATAPYVVAIATTCIAIGVVFDNYNEIENVVSSVYSYAKSLGKNVLDFFTVKGNQIEVSLEGVEMIRGTISSISNSGVMDSSIGSFPVTTGTSFANTNWTYVDIPLNGYGTYVFKCVSDFKQAMKTMVKANGVSKETNVVLDEMEVYFLISYGAEGFDITCVTGVHLDTYLEMLKNGTMRGNVFSSNVPLTSLQIAGGGFCYGEEVFGTMTLEKIVVGVGDFTNVREDFGFKDESISGTGSISITLPTVADELTWGELVGVDYSNLGSITVTDVKTGVSSDVVEGTNTQTGVLTSILEGIKSIVDVISNLVSNLLNGLKNLFLDLFVPDDNFFVNKFNAWKNEIENKFGVNMGAIEDLRYLGENGVKDISFVIMGVSVILPISIVNDVAPFTRMLCTGLVGIFICWYIYRNVYSLIRKSAPVGGSNHNCQ